MIRRVGYGVMLTMAILLLGSPGRAQNKPASRDQVPSTEPSDASLIATISGPGWFSTPPRKPAPDMVYVSGSNTDSAIGQDQTKTIVNEYHLQWTTGTPTANRVPDVGPRYR